jgi:hypothetical protein
MSSAMKKGGWGEEEDRDQTKAEASKILRRRNDSRWEVGCR